MGGFWKGCLSRVSLSGSMSACWQKVDKARRAVGEVRLNSMGSLTHAEIILRADPI
jgi:hypothetical protein